MEIHELIEALQKIEKDHGNIAVYCGMADGRDRDVLGVLVQDITYSNGEVADGAVIYYVP